MHRHAYKGRKLSLERDQRQALIRGQVTSLVLRESIETTLPKAKEIAPQFERLVTKAKAGTLHAQRQLRSELQTENAVQKMIQELAPAFADRQGGYTRIIKTGFRRGDNAPLAVVSLVLPEKLTASTKSSESSKTAKSGLAGKSPETPTEVSHEGSAGGQPTETPARAQAKPSTGGGGGVTGPANTQKRRTGNK